MGQALAKKRSKAWKRAVVLNDATRHKPSVTLPEMPWDRGADGPANRIGLVEEDAVDLDPATGRRQNPNNVKRVRRVFWANVYARQGRITDRQLLTALELFVAAAGASRQDPLAAYGLKVDDFTGKKEPEAGKYDSRRRFREMWARAPLYTRPALEWVVVYNRSAASMPGAKSGQSVERRMRYIRDGLDAIGNA